MVTERESRKKKIKTYSNTIGKENLKRENRDVEKLKKRENAKECMHSTHYWSERKEKK